MEHKIRFVLPESTSRSFYRQNAFMETMMEKRMNYVKHQSLVIKIFLLGIAVIFLFACGGGGSDSTNTKVLPITPGGYLVEGVSLGKVSVSTIKLAAESAGYSQFSKYMKYTIKLYKIKYNTTYKGQPIVASGLISYPTGLSDSMPTMIVGNYQSYADKDTPSEFDFPNNFTFFAAIASTGYLTLIPDMLGFGETKDKVFPMRNYEHTANAMIDFIYASEEFVKAIKLGVNGKKFLTGYSEGGYIAMATLKMIEERPASGISIDATAVGGGGYNLVNILKNEIIITTYDFPSDIAMLLYSYNSMYDWNRPLLDFFNEPYASRIPVLFNGEYNRQEINQQLTNSLDIFLNNDFLNNLRSDSDDELVLITALSNNSVDNWTPKSLLSIIHGRNDEIIPFFDSEETYNKMVANGSTSVTFTPIETGGHVDSGIEFIEIAVLWFNSLNP